MKKLHYMLLAFILFVSISNASAQKTEPVFEIKAGDLIANAKFLIQASTGELITGNDLKLMAIDPISKKVLWENNDFLALNAEDVSIIPGTPFIKIERSKLITVGNNKNTYIIQARDGKIAYDSKEEGISVRNTLLLPELNGLLVEYKKNDMISVAFIDFKQVKELWSLPIAKEKSGGIGFGALKRAIKSYTRSAFNIPPQVDAYGNLILVYNKEIFSINNTGNVAWKKEVDENISDAILGTENKNLFIGYGKYLENINTENGNSLLPKPIKMKDNLNGITPMGNNYIVYNETGINILDGNGNTKWNKDVSLGNISDVRYTDKGILAIESEKDETTLFWVGLDGKKIWSEDIKGAYILAEPTDKGIIYITTERSNILTYEKGKDVWNKDIKIKNKPFFNYDSPSKTLYVFEGSKLHGFNLNDITYKLVAEDIKLKRFKEEEERAILDIRKNGSIMVISGNQCVAAVNLSDGKILYNENFKDIGNTKRQLLMAAGTLVSVAGGIQNARGQMEMNIGLVNLSPSQMESGIKKISKGVEIKQAGDELYDEASKRFLASTATKDNLYILSEMPEGNGMLVWNKESGSITKKIIFKDTNPKYIIDEADDRLYVLIDNVIKVYALK